MRRIAPLLLVSALVLCAPLAVSAAAPTFERPVVLSNTPSNDVDSSDFWPVAATNGGAWVVAWSSNDTLLGTVDGGNNILFMRSTDGGLTFTDPALLSTNATGRAPALAAHGNRFIAVWDRGSKIGLARSDDGGATWSAPATLSSPGDLPSIATDGAGTWVIAWRRGPNSFAEGDIFFARSTDDGLNWSEPAALNTNSEVDVLNDWSPHVVWSNGVWGVVWVGAEVPTSVTSHVFFARSLDGQIWSAPLDLYPTSPTVTDRDIVLAGGGGSWVATWTGGNYNAGVQNILTVRSTDGGLTWSAPAILNTDGPSDGRDDYTPSVAAVDANTYAAVWVRQVPGADHQDVFSATSTDGGVTWSAPVPLNPVSAAAAGQNDLDFSPSLAADSAGHFFALWISNDRKLTSNTKTHDLDVVMALAGASCGNGKLDSGETCDDGDRGSLDCCNRVCAYDAPAAVCAADADPCSLERCDGAGTCGHQAAPLDTPCALDADLCTNDRCDGNFVCEHVFAPRAVCPGSADTGGSSLKIAGGSKRSLAWSLKHGPLRPLTLYVTGATYALCVYDGAGLVARVDMPVDTSCNGKSCWTTSNNAVKYKDRAGTPSGAMSATLQFRGGDETVLKLAGKGPNLATPALPLSLPVQAQLVSDELNNCFGATYSAAKLNSAAGFKAKSD